MIFASLGTARINPSTTKLCKPSCNVGGGMLSDAQHQDVEDPCFVGICCSPALQAWLGTERLRLPIRSYWSYSHRKVVRRVHQPTRCDSPDAAMILVCASCSPFGRLFVSGSTQSDDIVYPSSFGFVLIHIGCFAAIWTG